MTALRCWRKKMSRNLNGMDVDRGRMGKEKRSSLSGHQEDDGSSIEDLLNSISILSFKCIVNCVFVVCWMCTNM